MPPRPHTRQSPSVFPVRYRARGASSRSPAVALSAWGPQVHGRLASQGHGVYISPCFPVVSTPRPSSLTSVYSSSLHSLPEIPSVFSLLSEFAVSTRRRGEFSAHLGKAQGVPCIRQGSCPPVGTPGPSSFPSSEFHVGFDAFHAGAAWQHLAFICPVTSYVTPRETPGSFPRAQQ